jgi:DNA repair protein RadC
MAAIVPVIMADVPPDSVGHRSRLRTRLLDQGGGALADYELVEYLLALVIPRRDTKPLAKALLREFGGIGPLLSASPAALQRVDGVGETVAAALKIAQACALALLKSDVSDQPALASWQAVLDYLRADMAYRQNECFRVLYLNSKNALIRDEVMSEGTVDETAVHIREVARRAMELGASSLILVHNHPAGDPAPSRADIALTREIGEVCRRLKISLHDHVIIGATGHASFRSLGLI